MPMLEDNEDSPRLTWSAAHAQIVGKLRKLVADGKLVPTVTQVAREITESSSVVVLRALARDLGVDEPMMRQMIERGATSVDDAVEILLGRLRALASYHHPSNDPSSARIDEGKRTKIRARSRSGMPYWRAGLRWVADFVEVEVTDAQLAELRADRAILVEDATVPPAPAMKPLNVSDLDTSPRTLFEPPSAPPAPQAPADVPDESPKADAKLAQKKK